MTDSILTRYNMVPGMGSGSVTARKGRTVNATNVGHINVRTRDEDSYITSFGKHSRVVAFCPDSNGLYCRVDRCPNPDRAGQPVDPAYPKLPDPTPAQVLTVAKRYGDAPGRWVLESWIEWNDGRCIDVQFVRPG